MMTEAACITGVGAVTPLGPDLESSWRALLAGEMALRSGVADVAEALMGYPVGLAQLAAATEREGFLKPELRRLDPVSVQALCAAAEAIRDAGLETPLDDARTAVILGVGYGATTTHMTTVRQIDAGRATRLSPFTIPASMPNAAACNVSLKFGARGPSWTSSTACASGLDAMGMGLWLLQSGQAERVLVGGSEAIADSMGIGGMAAARALKPVDESGGPVLKPFDKTRAATAVGEGAAVFVLETPELAAKRGATTLGKLAGYGCGADAHHITAPRPDGAGAEEVMRLALTQANLTPADADAVFAHGTGTQLNDAMEGQAIARIFSKDDGTQGVHVVSTKGQYGHAMGASGPLNAAFALRALQENVVPANMPCAEPDPECGITPVLGQPLLAPLRAVLVNAFGFGGHNASIVLTQP